MKYSKLSEGAMKGVFALCALSCIGAIVLICGFLLWNAWPAFQQIGLFSFLLGTDWKPSQDVYGILPMIIGSLYVSAGAMALGVPVGVLSASYLVFFCPKALQKPFQGAVDLLAGIPSVVFGFFGLAVLVPAVQYLFGTNGKGILTASLLLAMMILPTIVSVCAASLKAVDSSYYAGSRALGASHEWSVYKVVFQAARPGIVSAIVLGLGRAVGETMAVIMVAGNAAILPDSITSMVRTLTGNIVLEMGYAVGLHRQALIATGMVLLVFILLINLSFQALANKEA